jgi:hypothetical protein
MKFYLKKKSSYSSALGDGLSLILYSFFLIMLVISLLGLINNTDFTMTQEQILFENWEQRNISFKGLIEKGFQLPIYDLKGNETVSVDDFNAGGLKAVNFGVNRDGLNFGEDTKSLTNEINQIVGI